MNDYHAGHDDDGDDSGMPDTSLLPDQGQARRACDLCRMRKVACDREEPCSTCVRGSSKCTYTSHQAVRPRRQRVLISEQYERKIDRIEERLSQVISLLQTMNTDSVSRDQTRQNDVLAERSRATSHQGSEPVLKSALLPNEIRNRQRPQHGPTARKTPSSTPADSSGYSARSISMGAIPADGLDSPDLAFEGESSLKAHADFASRFFEKAVQSAPDSSLGSEIEETLGALRQLVGAQAQNSLPSVDYPNARPSEDKKNLPMPPIQLTMSCLSIARHRVDIEAVWLSGFMTFDRFMQSTVDVYFTAGVTDAQYLIVNIGLYWLFMSLVALQPDETWPGIADDELSDACVLCRENIETSLAGLPMHLPNTLEYVIALSFAGSHTLEMSRPSLAWTLFTSAIQICQNLGFHRASAMEFDKPALRKLKYRTFWGLYVLEKCLALRLGRASLLQDCDISLPRPENLQGAGGLWEDEGPWIIFMAYCSTMGSIQGRVYTQLYSPGGLLEEDSVRAARAQGLVDEIANLSKTQPKSRVRELIRGHLSDEMVVAEASHNRPGRPLGVVEDSVSATLVSLDYLLDCFHLQELCILTLIHRAVPVPKGSPSAFTQNCIDTARLCLAMHQKIIASIPPTNINLLDMYYSWTILAVPFVPFIVIFCHIIESSARNTAYQEDLKRLEDFTTSLYIGGRLSGATGRLQKLCQVLFNVARKYTELKDTSSQVQSQRQFDTYIQALGLFGSMPAAGGGHAPLDGGVHGPFGGTGVNDQTMDVPALVLQNSAGFAAPMQQMDHEQQFFQVEQNQQGAILGDWFNSGQQMLGILEQGEFDFET
ncbi:RNA polymerase II-specific transcription factor-like protein [Microdochium nivale]|nr:RNA polymerase II-specific transcription factor-like protein [Microdochium nivale]